MSLPFNLQKLPPEALAILRYLQKSNPATNDQLEKGAGISVRLVGKGIRRLVNADYIELSGDSYHLTTEGKDLAQLLIEHEAGNTAGAAPTPKPEIMVQRHISVVMPRSFMPGNAGDLFIGVNPPEAEGERLSEATQLELRISAVGATLSTSNFTLPVPTNKAATPVKINLTPAQDSQMVRVRVDAFQILDEHNLEPLGGIYFDIRVATAYASQDATLRAVGMDVRLKTRS